MLIKSTRLFAEASDGTGTSAPAATPPAPVAPPASPAPVATPPAPKVAAPATAATKTDAKTVIDDNPVWLSERLRREGAAALKAAGIKVKKGDDPKQIAAEAKAKNESRKEKLKAEKARADSAEQEAANAKASAAAHLAALKVYAETELGQLTPKQQEVVKMAAGDDVAEQLKAIALFKSTGAFTPAASSTVSGQPAAPAGADNAAPAPIDPPANTTKAAPAPVPASPQSTDVRGQYENLKRTNPYLAANFILNHPELVPELKQQ